MWMRIFGGQRVRIDDITARESLYNQLRKAPQLRYTIEHVDRMKIDDPDRTYQWLLSEFVRHLDRTRMEWQRGQEETWLDQQTGSAPKANSAKGDGKGKKGSKGNTPTGKGGDTRPECFNWLRNGQCPHGEDCRYNHDPKLAGTQPNNQKGKGGKDKPKGNPTGAKVIPMPLRPSLPLLLHHSSRPSHRGRCPLVVTTLLSTMCQTAHFARPSRLDTVPTALRALNRTILRLGSSGETTTWLQPVLLPVLR